MTSLFQLAVFALIAFSFLLVIGVPVAFTYPFVNAKGNGVNLTQNKTFLFSGLGVWFILIFFVGILNSFVV